VTFLQSMTPQPVESDALELVLPHCRRRGKVLQPVTPERGEELMNWVYDLARVAPFAIKTTEAPSYRRIALGRMRGEGMSPEQMRRTAVYHGLVCAMVTVSCSCQTQGISIRLVFSRRLPET